MTDPRRERAVSATARSSSPSACCPNVPGPEERARRDRRGRLRGDGARPARLSRRPDDAARAPRRAAGSRWPAASSRLRVRRRRDLARPGRDARPARRGTDAKPVLADKRSRGRRGDGRPDDGVAPRASSCGARARGFEPTFHHHMGTFVEAPAEIERAARGHRRRAAARHRASRLGGGDPVTRPARLARARSTTSTSRTCGSTSCAARATGTRPGAAGCSASSAPATSTWTRSSPSCDGLRGLARRRAGLDPRPRRRARRRRSRRRCATGAGSPSTRVSEADRGHGGPSEACRRSHCGPGREADAFRDFRSTGIRASGVRSRALLRVSADLEVRDEHAPDPDRADRRDADQAEPAVGGVTAPEAREGEAAEDRRRRTRPGGRRSRCSARSVITKLTTRCRALSRRARACPAARARRRSRGSRRGPRRPRPSARPG